MIILLQDVTIARVPPPRRLLQPESKAQLTPHLFRTWLTSCREFLSKYDLSQDNVKNLAEILLDPGKYRIIKLLRNKFLEVSSMPQLKTTGDLNPKSMQQLVEANIVLELQGPKGTIYALKSDIVASKFFPQKILDLVLRNYHLKSFPDQTLLGQLSEIKNFYLASEVHSKV